MDARLLNLSHSSILALHECPRKFELYRLGAVAEVIIEESPIESLTFLYGHIVGEGIQLALQNQTEDQIIWSSFLRWNLDLFARDDKRNKDFWQAITAVKKFIYQVRNGELADYDLVYFDGKPAVELSFIIELPGGFKYRGFLDAALQHRYTQEVVVLENKTTGATTFNQAQYKNSFQAIGYSVVLDHIFPALSSYKVLYAAYLTKQEDFVTVMFEKTLLQRAVWLQELLIETHTIELYARANLFPRHGESCFRFNRECQYFHCCHMSTEHMVAPLTQDTLDKLSEDEAKYQIRVTFQDLINSQLAKQD